MLIHQSPIIIYWVNLYSYGKDETVRLSLLNYFRMRHDYWIFDCGILQHHYWLICKWILMSWCFIRIESSRLSAKFCQSMMLHSRSHRCRGKLALEAERQTLNRAHWEVVLLKSVCSRHLCSWRPWQVLGRMPESKLWCKNAVTFDVGEKSCLHYKTCLTPY